MLSNGVPDFRLEDLRLTSVPGYAMEAIVDSTTPGRLIMGLQQAMGKSLAEDTLEMLLQTSRGDIQGILTLCQGQPGAVLWLAGRGPSLNGPAGGIYADLSQELRLVGVSSFRMGYRDPLSFPEDVLDALACLSFLKGIGAHEVVVVGHGLGGAVAIATAAILPSVKAVVALSSPVDGTELVNRIAPRPLLLVHGGKDTQAPPSASQDIYRRAGEPKELIIYPEASFPLAECRGELEQKLGTWLLDQFGKGAAYLEATTSQAGHATVLVISIPGPADTPSRELVLTRGDLVTLETEAIVCPTGSWLDLRNTPLGRAIIEQGGMEIQQDLWSQAPLVMGEVGVTGAGRLKFRHVLHAITGGEGPGDAPMPTEVMIAQTTHNSLLEADKRGLKSIGFPAFASGARGFPPEKTAQIMVAVIAQHLTGQTSLERVVLSMVAEGTYRAFEAQLRLLP